MKQRTNTIGKQVKVNGDQGEEQAGQVFPADGEAGAGGRARAGRRVGVGRD